MADITNMLITTLEETEYQALVLLSDSASPMSGRMVASELKVAPTTATTALAKLRAAGFAGSSREGRALLWHLATDNDVIRSWLKERSSGMSPYATGGGGVTLERKVAAVYLGHLLTGDGAMELGGSRSVVGVAFQQSPDHSVDDLVIHAARDDENAPSLVLAVAVRRSPKLVQSDESTRKLFHSFIREVIDAPYDDVEHRIALVVAGDNEHALQLRSLAGLAAKQSSARQFFSLIRTPKKFDRSIVNRLSQIEKLVRSALVDSGISAPVPEDVRERTYELLSRLVVLLPRIEYPDEVDWSALANQLVPFSVGQKLHGGTTLRDRLLALASEYAPTAAIVDLKLLRRDAHDVLHDKAQRDRAGLLALTRLHERTWASVRSEIGSIDSGSTIQLDRSKIADDLIALAETGGSPVIVWGESGVGKSALVVNAVVAATRDSESVQALCLNLRQLPKSVVEFESYLGAPLDSLLSDLNAPLRFLVVDGADAIAEGMIDQFQYLVKSGLAADVRLIAIAASDMKQFVRDTVAELSGGNVVEFSIPALSDEEIDNVVSSFPELAELAKKPRSRELLRRPVVVDLLVRGGVSGAPLSDADAMRQIWSGLVLRPGQTDRGFPDARELALLRIADLGLRGGDSLEVLGSLDPTALEGLRRDGLLRTPDSDPFRIGPEFTHDELRRYAVARVMLTTDDPTAKLVDAGVPRWALGAARLACQELLSAKNSVKNPSRGRFAKIQEAFDALVAAGHGDRWGDVPGEALLTIGEPEPVLRDAWQDLGGLAGSGLERLCRLVDQRLRDESGLIRIGPIEPLIDLLLDEEEPFWTKTELLRIVRDWLRALVIARAPKGEARRVRFHDRLISTCLEAERQLETARADAEAARAARSKEEIEEDVKLSEQLQARAALRAFGFSSRTRRRSRAEMPHIFTDESMLELLALLGPDLGEDGEAILQRVGHDAPSWLWPAVEELFTGVALAAFRRGLLAELTEAYYLDEEEDGSGLHEDGIRDHRARSLGIMPLAAWYRGPFMALFQSDFQNGVNVLNRMLNHAARARVQTLEGHSYYGITEDAVESDRYRTFLDITGARREYVGDEHVWSWYRGTAVGPYPCVSALQALERVCDQFIENGASMETILSILLSGCENLAMVGLVVGILVRHLEQADRLLDPYLADPDVWHYEFSRLVAENSGLAAPSDGLASPDRRGWSLREAALWLTLGADDSRSEELKSIGQELVETARRTLNDSIDGAEDQRAIEYLDVVRAWASGLDRASYVVRETDDGKFHVQSTPPEDVVQSLQAGNEDILRSHETTRLLVRYYIDVKKGDAVPIGADEIVADLITSKELLDNPPALNATDPWDTPTIVSAAALEAVLKNGLDIDDEYLGFAAEVILYVGEGSVPSRQYEFDESYFEQGADRIAARVLPLLMLPSGERACSLVETNSENSSRARVITAMHNLARAVPNEVRVHLARGLDPVWISPCREFGTCHHLEALEIAIDTMRDSAMGPWVDSERHAVVLFDPVDQSLVDIADGDINFMRLDAAIRALAPAVIADNCVSVRARDLLACFLAAYRRALLAYERDMDYRGTHALIAARALLTIARDGDEVPIYEHIDAIARDGAQLSGFLRALSAVSEESEQHGAVAEKIWPGIMSHVLEMHHAPGPLFQDKRHEDDVLAALLPNAAGEVAYLYREVEVAPCLWWKPIEWQDVVGAWLTVAQGSPTCVDRMVGFLDVLGLEDQAKLGVPWLATLILSDPARIGNRSFLISSWLINVRSASQNVGANAQWQQIIDALVVAGVAKLAPYSE